MPDDKTKRQPQDGQRINIHEPYEVTDWSKRLGVTPEQLKQAVKDVGPMADDVKKKLGKK